MMVKDKKPTLKDIAKITGVAVSTVSRAFSGRAKISEYTKERIVKTALELGFVIKGNNNYNSTKIIAFIVYYQRKTLYENPFFISSIHGAYSYCSKEDYYLQVYFCEKKYQEFPRIPARAHSEPLRRAA